MRLASSGRVMGPYVTSRELDRWADAWAEGDTLLWRVCRVLIDGEWHTGTEIANAYRGEYGQGWEWQSCVAQLRGKLRPKGGDILGEPIKGRHEYRYRMIDPRRVQLDKHLRRSQRIIQARKEQTRLRI